MSQRHLKVGYFVLEGLNSFGTVYYLFYLYFFMQTAFGFDNKANLALAALNGLIYMVGSVGGGKFAQRFGYFRALKLGFIMMLAPLGAGLLVHSAAGQIVVMTFIVLGMCFTWPTLEALVSEDESPAGLQKMVGIYNVVWAGTGALAYFIGGAMLDKLGLESLFYVPIAVQLVQLGLTVWLERRSRQLREDRLIPIEQHSIARPTAGQPSPKVELNPRPFANARLFLRMAWLANPFAYVASNTLIAVIPGLAKKLGLSTTLAGFCCSIWCFARLGTFFGLWFWSGWHYRFSWLLAAYLVLMGTFATLVIAPNLAVLVLAQILFGCALGIIYYSSLFYSMDLSETKSEHGGIHEAAIGLGNFAGPAVGAASVYFLPQYPASAVTAVSVLLLFGFGGLVGLWWKGQKVRGSNGAVRRNPK